MASNKNDIVDLGVDFDVLQIYVVNQAQRDSYVDISKIKFGN